MSLNPAATDSLRGLARLPFDAGRASSGFGADHLIGLAVAALAPSLFWTVLVKLACLTLGVMVSWAFLAAIGGGIFCLLASVYALRARSR